jgi:hypothetical protein
LTKKGSEYFSYIIFKEIFQNKLPDKKFERRIYSAVMQTRHEIFLLSNLRYAFLENDFFCFVLFSFPMNEDFVLTDA